MFCAFIVLVSHGHVFAFHVVLCIVLLYCVLHHGPDDIMLQFTQVMKE